MTNENNYLGATTTLVGYASGEARTPRYDKDGSSGVLEVSFAINEGYKKGDEFIQTGTTWYTYSAAGDYAESLRVIGKGDKVRINDAKQEVREYENKDGEKVKAIGLRYGSIVVLEKSNRDNGDGFAPTGGGGGF
jgi:hypothetical protein